LQDYFHFFENIFERPPSVGVVPGWSVADGLFPLSIPRSNRTTAARPGDHDAPVALEDLGELAKRMNVMPTCVGFVHASLGNHDEAFVCFRRGVELENAIIMYLREYCVCCRFGPLARRPTIPGFP
jgi:hypothetical protein